MNLITPEVIFDRFATRLRDKYEDDLSYVIYAERGFEKWLQWELYLSLVDYVSPIAYGKNGNAIKGKDENEKVADIALEYKIEEKDIRPDLFVAEKPFLLKCIDPESWNVQKNEEKNTKKLRDSFDSKKNCYHYIELKTDWVNLNSENSERLKFKKFENDIKKIKDFSIPYKRYQPSTYMAMSLVTFFNRKKNNENEIEDKTDIQKLLDDYPGESETKLPKSKKDNWDNWLYSHIGEEGTDGGNTYLVGTYREYCNLNVTK